MEDCYFFLYSECKLKNRCMYRHNPLSKDNLITCKAWKKTGNCRIDCPFRHSEYHVVKPRKEMMCFWEDKGGCTKYRCEYKHVDPAKDEWKEVRIKSLNEIIESKIKIENEIFVPSKINTATVEEDETKEEEEIYIKGPKVKNEEDISKSNEEFFCQTIEDNVGNNSESTLKYDKRTDEDVFNDLNKKIKIEEEDSLDKELEELDNIINDDF